MTVKDGEIIKRVLDGDSNAYAELLKKYQDRVFRAFYSWTSNYEDALDLTQDVFLTAYKSLSQFRGEAAFFTWVMKIALNKKNNYYKKKMRYPQDVSYEYVSEESEYAKGFEDERQNLESVVINDEVKEMALEELMKIPEKYRDVLILRDIEEHTYDEVAGALDLPLQTVKTRIHRGRKMLLNQLRSRGLL